MLKFKILDCTLRDGGYYTDWDFSNKIVSTYMESMNNLPIDYLEIGYRNNAMKDYLGEFFYCPPYVLNKFKENSKKRIVIILDEKNVQPKDVYNLLSPCVGIVDMVRIALDPQNLSRALKLAEEIKKLGFEVGFNVMYMSKWREFPGFLSEVKYVDDVADYFYMVDSYGGVYPQDIVDTINLIREKTNVKLGFHGHNNLELALINTLSAIDNGIDIIDATVTGMGRGAGNLKTELLLTALNAKSKLNVDFNALTKVVDEFSELQESYGWGTNLPYMVSGANSLPQKNVMEWVSKRFYSFNSIIRALHNQKENIVDNEKLEIFKPAKTYKNILIVGGGPSVVTHAEAIKQFLISKDNICLIHASSKNAIMFNDINIDQYYCLVGNEGYRLETVFNNFDSFKGMCVLPPYPRRMGTYIPNALRKFSYELEKIVVSEIVKDSHTVLGLQLAYDLKPETVYIVGYDGYTGSNMEQREHDLLFENDCLFQESKNKGNFKLASLTPTRYKNLDVISVYSLLS